MKLNQELIKRLASGEIVYQHTGTAKEYAMILRQAFPDDYVFYSEHKIYNAKSYITEEHYYFYETIERMHQFGNYKELPIYTTEQFFEQNSEVKQTMDDETRELAKRLFVALMTNPELDVIKKISISIEQAELFMKRLNAKS